MPKAVAGKVVLATQDAHFLGQGVDARVGQIGNAEQRRIQPAGGAGRADNRQPKSPRGGEEMALAVMLSMASTM